MAIGRLQSSLISMPQDGEWLLLTNLSFSSDNRRQSDEIDILAIGPPGVRVVEVKHQNATYVRKNAAWAVEEAERITRKAKRVGTWVRDQLRAPKAGGGVGWVVPILLLTKLPAERVQDPIRGVAFHTLKTWEDALGFHLPRELSNHQVQALGKALTPANRPNADGRLARLGDYERLEPQTKLGDRFHRVYKATHSSRGHRAILHLYDRSASEDANAEVKAQREFEALHRLQRYDWAPRVRDSFQPVPGFIDELHFFTVADPDMPSIEEQATDGSWDTQARLSFARSAVKALQELHGAGNQNQPMLHRNLTPTTILVKDDNSPILTGLNYARIPDDETIASQTRIAREDWHPATAPEVRSEGLARADKRSDVYSLCWSLITLFEPSNEQVRSLLKHGMAEDPSARADLAYLSQSLGRLLGEKQPAPIAPPVSSWEGGEEVSFEGRRYRIISRLGSGGVGSTFKVVELDYETGEDVGTYVAKVVHDRQDAERVMRTYHLVRPHLHHSNLSIIYQVASEWRDNGFTALMTWKEGDPLSGYAGQFTKASDRTVAIDWLRSVLIALDVLHRNGLVHGDVSPGNMIVSDSAVVLTDYDCVTKVGESYAALGTVTYCSPSLADRASAQPSDDIYALAASFFYVLSERHPFQHDGNLVKDRGLNWGDIDRDAYPVLAPFLDRATDPKREKRYATVEEALRDLAERPPNKALPRTQQHDQPEDIVRAIRADRHQSWKNLRKAVRALSDLPHEPFGTANVAASSKSAVRTMQRATGLSLDRLLEILDSM